MDFETYQNKIKLLEERAEQKTIIETDIAQLKREIEDAQKENEISTKLAEQNKNIPQGYVKRD